MPGQIIYVDFFNKQVFNQDGIKCDSEIAEQVLGVLSRRGASTANVAHVDTEITKLMDNAIIQQSKLVERSTKSTNRVKEQNGSTPNED